MKFTNVVKFCNLKKEVESCQCNYPFVYNNVEYNSCLLDTNSKYWCQTNDSQWMNCPHQCEFPFVYKSKTYTSCISLQGEAPWCSSHEQYDGFRLPCGQKCFSYQRKGFLFVTMKVNMLTAKTYCEERNMSLSKVYDQSHMDWMVAKINAENNGKYWIDLTDQYKEGEFVHIDKSPASFIQWGSQYPDNKNDIQHCTFIYPSNGYGWMNDGNCESKQSFVCESEQTDCEYKYDPDHMNVCDSKSCSPYGICAKNDSNVGINCDCDENYSGDKCDQKIVCEQYRHKSFLFVSTTITFERAIEYCENRNMSLARVYDKDHLSWMYSTMAKINIHSFWIDMTDQYYEGQFVHYDNSSIKFFKWASGKPNNQYDSDCVILYASDQQLWMIDVLCRQSFSFVCESENTDCQSNVKPSDNQQCNSHSCPPYGACVEKTSNNIRSVECICDNDYYGLKCEYKMKCFQYHRKGFLIFEERKTFKDAIQFCEKERMTIARYNDYEEFKSVGTEALENYKVERFWIDATDEVEEGKFLQHDNTPVGFMKWISGEPNNWANNEHCTTSMFRDNEYFMNDIACRNRYSYICESAFTDCRPKLQSNNSVDACTPNSCSTYGTCVQLTNGETECLCDPPYIGKKCDTKLNCHQYKRKGFHFVNEAKTFKEAVEYCENEKMSLVRIYDYEELKWIGSTAVQNNIPIFWIDATDQFEEGKFLHNDNSTIYYFKWNNEEPNNNADNEHCVMVIFSDDNFVMNDFNCNRELKFVCESEYTDCIPPKVNSTSSNECNSKSCSPYGECVQSTNDETVTCQCDFPYSGTKCDKDETKPPTTTDPMATNIEKTTANQSNFGLRADVMMTVIISSLVKIFDNFN